MTRIAVLASGSGSNLQALIEATQSGQIDGQISCVITDQPQAGALQRAQTAGIKTYVIPAEDETLLQNTLDAHDIELVCLAGYMRILSADLVNYYAGRMLNIHPALLPRYRGLHTHRRVLEAGDAEHGCSVHFVTAELDAGPIVLQARLSVLATDTPETLAQRVLEYEHKIYPLAAQWFCTGALRLEQDTVWVKDKPIDAPIQYPLP